MWQQWVNAVIGLWLLISAFVPSLMNVGNIATCSGVILVLAVWGALAKKGPTVKKVE